MENINNSTLTEPKEKYSFSFTAQEISLLGKKVMRGAHKKLIIFLAVLAAAALFELTSESNGYLFTGIFIVLLCMFISGCRSSKKAWRQSEEQIPRCVYEYDVYDDYLIVRIRKDQETVRWQKVGFSQITGMCDYDGIIQITFTGQTWLLRRSELTPESELLSMLSKFTTAKPRYKNLRIKK